MPASACWTNPEAQLSDLMQYIKGPDFPTRGHHHGPVRHPGGLRHRGRGRIVIRARHEFEEFGNGRTRIIITEIPYQVNKRMLIKNMADQVEDKRLEGISNIQDETDRNGMRIVIELKRDANPQVVLNRLFAQTQLQTSFAVTHAGPGGGERQAPAPDSVPAAHPGRVHRPTRSRSSPAAPGTT